MGSFYQFIQDGGGGNHRQQEKFVHTVQVPGSERKSERDLKERDGGGIGMADGSSTLTQSTNVVAR